jgi:hypothetical protein
MAVALVALDVVVVANRQTWRAYDRDPYEVRLGAARAHPWDLVLVGGSPMMCAGDPGVLSGTTWRGQPLDRVYNLSLPLATANEVELAVAHGLPTPPRLLVYGVSATDFSEERVEPEGPRRLMNLADLGRWARQRPDAATWAARHFAEQRLEETWSLWRYRNGIRLWAADRVDGLWPGACPAAAAEARSSRAVVAAIHQQGFQVQASGDGGRLDRLKDAGAVPSTFPFMNQYRIDHYPACLHRLLDWAVAHGTAVVLVDLPTPADLDGRLYPREFAEYRAGLAQWASNHRTPLLRATREAVGLTDADFADLIHLNIDGAARFSTWLRRRLEDGAEQTTAGGTGP